VILKPPTASQPLLRNYINKGFFLPYNYGNKKEKGEKKL